jgi:membrane-associated phospholipid phosphatase
MESMRKVWTVLASAWVAAWLVHALLDWVLGFNGSWEAVAVLAAAALGAIAGLGDARQLRPMGAQERRDALLGWVAVIGALCAVACLALTMPWGLVCAAVVVAVTVFALGRVRSAPPHMTDSPSPLNRGRRRRKG